MPLPRVVETVLAVAKTVISNSKLHSLTCISLLTIHCIHLSNCIHSFRY